MTPWEWSMAALMLGPMLAVFAMWFLAREQAQSASAAILALTGAAGVAACAYGVVATEPFLLPTDVFFGMVATFDKFSAMFFFPLALVITALGIQWYTQRTSSSLGTVRVLGASLVVVGTTWTFLSTNILGVIAALMTLACGEYLLSVRSVRLVVLRITGILALAVGLFILSSGALFNDFATLAYISAELDPARLAGAFGAVLFGVALLSGTWPCVATTIDQTSRTPVGAERALLRSTFLVIPLYLFIRLILFILPPLSVWFAVPVSVIGVFTILSATHFASKHRVFSETVFVSSAGVALFMTSVAMAFQALALYEGMNVALFATMLSVIGAVLAGSAQEFMPKRGVLGITAGLVAVQALPPSILFVSVWMFVSVVVGNLSALPQVLVLWLAVGLLFLLGAFVRRGYASVAQIRLAFSNEQYASSEGRNIPFLLLAGVSTLGALFVPYVLSTIGAGPLTLGAETWMGGVVAADGALRLGVVLVGVGGLSAAFWVLRDKTATVSEGASDEALGASGTKSETGEARVAIVWREMRKVVAQYVATPALEKARAWQTWHDTHASKPVSPALGLMLLTVILTLAIAL